MKLLVVRHGAAMEREEFARTGESDDLRPLTDEGKAEMESVAAGLRAQLETLDLLATSPLVRARQTAEIVAAAYGIGAPEITSSLVPGTPFEEFEKWCSGIGEKDAIGVVGHEPHLSLLVRWLLADSPESEIHLKKGGACLMHFESQVSRGSGKLEWLLGPSKLANASE